MKNIFKLRKGSIIILTLIFSFSFIFFPLYKAESEQLAIHSIDYLAIQQPGVIYAIGSKIVSAGGAKSYTLLRTTNDGKNWNWDNSADIYGNVKYLAREKTGIVYFGTEFYIYKTDNNGECHCIFQAPSHNLSCIAIGQDEAVYAGENIAGEGKWIGGVIYKTTNGGENWFKIGFTPPLGIHSLSVEQSEIIYAGTDEGVYKTTNGGGNWTQVGESMSMYISELTIEQPGIIYAMTYSFDTNINRIYKTTNSGDRWFQPAPKLSDIIFSLAIEKPNVAYTGTRNGVYKTTNGGVNWFQTGFNNIYGYCLAVEEPEIVYCGSINGIHKTTNGGITWTCIGPELAKTYRHYAGNDRYKTAVEISRSSYSYGTETVVLARGDDFADALCGVPLATKYNAPLLLTPPESLGEDAREEIKRLGAKEVIMVGSNDALSDTVLDDLEKIGITNEKIHRIGGVTRYETSADIARWLNNPENKSAFIVTGEDYPDAISCSSIAASYGMPVLLVRGDRGEIPQAIQDVLKEKGIKRTLIVGGSDVVASDIASWLDKNSYPVRRISGETRYETDINLVSYCLNQAEDNPRLALNLNNTFLAYGENFPDALSAGVMAAKSKSPVILTRDNFVPDSVKGFFSLNKNFIVLITVVGDYDVVSNAVIDEVLSLIKI